jgi:hypothetical protein
MTGPIIDSPKGKVILNEAGTQARLEFDTNFIPKWSGNYSAAQKFVDNEVLRLSEPYIPLLTSMLIKSGILGTDVGSGRVKWIAPYSAAQYYSARESGSQTGPLRGPFWFERMKAAHGVDIIVGARRLAGGSK